MTVVDSWRAVRKGFLWGVAQREDPRSSKRKNMRYSQRNLKSLVTRETIYIVLIQLFKFLRHTLLIIWFHSQFSIENVLLNI